MTSSIDQARIRTAAWRVGAFVAVGATVVIAAGVAILVAVLLLTARPDDHHVMRPGESDGPGGSGGSGGSGHPVPDGDRVVVDLDHVLPWVLVLGVVGVALLTVVAWLAARRSVRPLGEALALQRAFVADASHEMRTPLTALSARVQTLQRRHDRGDPIEPTIAALRADIDVLDEVLTDMLLAAEGAASGGTGEVDSAIGAAVRTVAPLAEAAGVQVEANAVGSLRVRMPGPTLARVCIALLDNAIQHAPRGSRVTVSAQPEGDAVAIRVVDAGPGVPVDDQERIFERFARGAESGRRRGFGLGLALVREAATAAGGTIEIESTSPAGTTFRLTLPRD